MANGAGALLAYNRKTIAYSQGILQPTVILIHIRQKKLLIAFISES